MCQEIGQSGGDLCNDPDEDDQRNTIADAAFGDLLAQPHQEHGAAHKRNHHGRAEEPTRIGRQIARFQRHGQTVGLPKRQHNGQVTGVLVQLAPPHFTFFFQGFPRFIHCTDKLHDDRGGNIGHDAKRKDTHPADRAAGEHVQHAPDARCCFIHKLAQRQTVNAGNRNIRPDTVDNQQTKRKKDAFAKVSRLCQRHPSLYLPRVDQHQMPSASLSVMSTPPDRGAVGGAKTLSGVM